MINVPLMEGYWTLKLEGYKRDKKVMCEKSEIVFKRKRTHHGGARKINMESNMHI
jgi:hypothetical protein